MALSNGRSRRRSHDLAMLRSSQYSCSSDLVGLRGVEGAFVGGPFWPPLPFVSLATLVDAWKRRAKTMIVQNRGYVYGDYRPRTLQRRYCWCRVGSRVMWREHLDKRERSESTARRGLAASWRGAPRKMLPLQVALSICPRF